MDGVVNEDFLAAFDAFIVRCRALIDVLTLDQSRFNWRISEEALTAHFIRCVASPFVFDAGSQGTAGRPQSPA
jgi:hypothetical protein